MPVLNLSVDRSSTLSFNSAGTPVPAEWDPRAIFTRLFADNSPEAKQRTAARFDRNKSILVDVLESPYDLANILIGTASGVQPMGHVNLEGEPVANLYVRMLHAVGVPLEKFADSTGPLPLS